MNTIVTPGRLRSMLVKTGAALAACTLITLSALGSAASAHADDALEPIAAVSAPAEPTEAVEPAESTEAAEPVEAVAPVEPAALAAPTDPAAAAATPVANNDVFAASSGVADLAPSQLYVNDSDQSPTGIEIDDPNGVVTMSGGWIHVPIANGFSGTVTFNYRFTNAIGTSNWALVTMVASAGSQQPIAYSDSFTTPMDVALTVAAPGLLANDDAAGGILTLTGLSDLTGQVVINSNGSFEYTPPAGFLGVKTFYYQATSSGLPTNWAKVTIGVTNSSNGPTGPVAVADSYQTAQGVVLDVAAKGVLLNDSSSTATVFDTNDSTGEVTLAFDGALHYTPPAGFTGTKTFEYRILDGLLVSNWATITIEVTAAPPVLPTAPVAVNDKYTMPKDTTLTIDAPGVLSNDSSGIVWSQGGFYSGSMTLQFNGSFVYTPDAGFTGTSVIEYTILNNGMTSNVATITIEVLDTTTPTLQGDDPVLISDIGSDSLAFTGVDSTWLALPALSIVLLGMLALGYSAVRRRRAGTV